MDWLVDTWHWLIANVAGNLVASTICLTAAWAKIRVLNEAHRLLQARHEQLLDRHEQLLDRLEQAS